MKIVPLPPPLTQVPGATPAASVAAPFADYLEGPPPPADRARSFAELGVFGRGALTPAQDVSTHPEVIPQAPLPALAVSAVQQPAAAAQSQANAGLACNPLDMPKLASPSRPAPIAKAAARATGLPAPLAEAPRLADEPEAPAPAAARRRPVQAPPRPGVSLILSEKDGAVEIVAGTPALDPEIRSALRRLAEAILARSGLRLAQFQLNGARVRPDSVTSPGDSHGTRTN